MSEELFFADLPYVRIQEILDGPRTPVLLWPVGSTEPHGPHSPLATDPIISIGIAERVARRLADDPELKVLILPTLSYAVTRYTAGFAGAIHVGEETLQGDRRRRLHLARGPGISATSCS